MKQALFVAVGSTASTAVIQLAKKMRDENLDKEDYVASEYKYITLDTAESTKGLLEDLYPNKQRVYGIHVKSENLVSSPTLKTLLEVRLDWKQDPAKLQLGSLGALGERRKLTATRTWVEELEGQLKIWYSDDPEKRKELTKELTIWVVGTACGATSTGMYWDVAGFLRNWADQEGPAVCGVVCLTDFGKTPKMVNGKKYPILRNFCTFVQDMRQIAILNSLRKSDTGGKFRPVSFRQIAEDKELPDWEDSRLELFGDRDVRSEVATSVLPLDILLLLPPPFIEAENHFSEHLFACSTIIDVRKALEKINNDPEGCHFGGMNLAMAESELYGAMKTTVQSQWQAMVRQFLQAQEGRLDEQDQEALAQVIRPVIRDGIQQSLAPSIGEAYQWFEEWRNSISAGKTPEHSPEQIVGHLKEGIEQGGGTAYLAKPSGDAKPLCPMPFALFGKDGLFRRLWADSEASKRILLKDGVTMEILKNLYVAVCGDIKKRGGKDLLERDRKLTDLQKHLKDAGRLFQRARKQRESALEVRLFGVQEGVREELEQEFEKHAQDWFLRCVEVLLMNRIGRDLPSETDLKVDMENFSKNLEEACREGSDATPHEQLADVGKVERIDMAEVLFLGMKKFDPSLASSQRVDGLKRGYEQFVDRMVSKKLETIAANPRFSWTSFQTRFDGNVQGYSTYFARSRLEYEKQGGRAENVIMHIFKHAGEIQKPSSEAIWALSGSFESLSASSKDDPFDPFSKGETKDPHSIAPAENGKNLYFGPFSLEEVPKTFRGMWAGILALDKSWPELLKQIYPSGCNQVQRDAVETSANQLEVPDNDRRDFIRLINLIESVELGILVGLIEEELDKVRSPGEMHLKVKDEQQDLAKWSEKKTTAFLSDGKLVQIDVRTMLVLLKWIRAENKKDECRELLARLNDMDWRPLTDTTFDFMTGPASEELSQVVKGLRTYFKTRLECVIGSHRSLY